MTVASTTSVNVKQAVPFFGVTNMEASLRFYVDGLGFKMKHRWIPNREEDKPDGRIRWCWLELGDAAIMLQEFLPEHQPKEMQARASRPRTAPACVPRGCWRRSTARACVLRPHRLA